MTDFYLNSPLLNEWHNLISTNSPHVKFMVEQNQGFSELLFCCELSGHKLLHGVHVEKFWKDEVLCLLKCVYEIIFINGKYCSMISGKVLKVF